MPDDPAASVIIPTRNCRDRLPAAIASVGSRQDIEIIVVDDASTDGTMDWLRTAARTDRRIVPLSGTGVGPSPARNVAIAAARAPLLAFLDADARWHADKLDRQLALHRSWPAVGFSFTDYRQITPAGEARGTCFAFWRGFRNLMAGHTAPFLLGPNAVAALFAENVVGTSTVMARTDLVRALGGFSTQLPSSEDWDLWLRLAQRVPVMCIPAVLADDMVRRAEGLTSHMRVHALSMRIVAARHEAAVRAANPRATRRFMARLMEANAELAQVSGKRWGELGCRMAALAWAPSWRRLRAVGGAARRAAAFRRLRRTPALPLPLPLPAAGLEPARPKGCGF